MPLSRPAHSLSYEEVLKEIGTNIETGLTVTEAQSRLEQHGQNDLGDVQSASPMDILLRQVANAMTLVRRNSCVL